MIPDMTPLCNPAARFQLLRAFQKKLSTFSRYKLISIPRCSKVFKVYCSTLARRDSETHATALTGNASLPETRLVSPATSYYTTHTQPQEPGYPLHVHSRLGIEEQRPNTWKFASPKPPRLWLDCTWILKNVATMTMCAMVLLALYLPCY